MYLDTSDDSEGDREEKRVNEALDWLQDGHVLNQRVVPKEAEYECADEDGKQQNQNFGESIRRVLGLDKILNHL